MPRYQNRRPIPRAARAIVIAADMGKPKPSCASDHAGYPLRLDLGTGQRRQ